MHGLGASGRAQALGSWAAEEAGNLSAALEPRPKAKEEMPNNSPQEAASLSQPRLHFRRRGEFLRRKPYPRAALRGPGRTWKEEETGRRPSLTPRTQGHGGRPPPRASEDLEPGGRRHDIRVRNVNLSCPFTGRVTWSPDATGLSLCTGTTRHSALAVRLGAVNPGSAPGPACLCHLLALLRKTDSGGRAGT